MNSEEEEGKIYFIFNSQRMMHKNYLMN